MISNIQFQINPEDLSNTTLIKQLIAEKLKLKGDFYFKLQKKSIDARSKNIKLNVSFLVSLEKFEQEITHYFHENDVSKSPEIAIIGAGPAGLFAALKAIELGLKPIILNAEKMCEQEDVI
jgi:uncharacterized FAD-dependent dehydrogenase